jgi:hypothetical protein
VESGKYPQFKIQGLYTSEGWDFAGETANGEYDYWTIIENVTYPRLSWECFNPPAGDVNGDCMQDLLDFVEISRNWLECGKMNPELCP